MHGFNKVEDRPGYIRYEEDTDGFSSGSTVVLDRQGEDMWHVVARTPSFFGDGVDNTLAHSATKKDAVTAAERWMEQHEPGF